MKNYIIIFFALLYTGVAIGQNTKPKFEKQDDLVKATYFYEDGNVKQIGFFKNKKLHGEWTYFNQKGEKTTIAKYENGMKTGTWLVLSDGIVKEVTYDKNKIVEVKDLEETDLAFTN